MKIASLRFCRRVVHTDIFYLYFFLWHHYWSVFFKTTLYSVFFKTTWYSCSMSSTSESSPSTNNPASCSTSCPKFPDKPYQPAVNIIPPQRLSWRNLHFQKSWFDKYKWLHYCVESQSVMSCLCAWNWKQQYDFWIAKKSRGCICLTWLQ